MSSKALHHRKGELVLINQETDETTPVQPILDEFQSKIDKLQDEDRRREG